jgi:hypothetical protein
VQITRLNPAQPFRVRHWLTVYLTHGGCYTARMQPKSPMLEDYVQIYCT